MADSASDQTPQAPAGAGAPDAATLPVLQLLGQYTRDLSFENPNGAKALSLGNSAPTFNVGINVGVHKESADTYLVELTLNAKAERSGTVMFNAELVYGGVFRIKNIPENQMAPVLMIECPRLIFPFARQILANVTGTGGFPPLMLEPVDFTALYRQNLQQQAAQKTN